MHDKVKQDNFYLCDKFNLFKLFAFTFQGILRCTTSTRTSNIRTSFWLQPIMMIA